MGNGGLWYRERLIVSGRVVEHFWYERPVRVGRMGRGRGLGGAGEEGEDEDKREAYRRLAVRRARSKLRRLVNANVGGWRDARGVEVPPKFVTLTYRENVMDIDYSNGEFTRFIKRLGRKTGQKLEYVAVIEFQERGAIHYHVLFFNLPYVPKEDLYEVWRNGFVQINRVDRVEDVGSYMVKYMGKGTGDERLRGEKSYFCSRGLRKPLEVREGEIIWQVMGMVGDLSRAYVREYYIEGYSGKVRYTRIILGVERAHMVKEELEKHIKERNMPLRAEIGVMGREKERSETLGDLLLEMVDEWLDLEIGGELT